MKFTQRTFGCAVIVCLFLAACTKSSSNPFPTAEPTTPASAMPATDPTQDGQTPSPSTTTPGRQPRTRHDPAPLREVVASDAETGTYTVQPSDTLNRIAGAVGSPVAALQRLNQMGRSKDIAPGQTLEVPLPLQGHAPSVKLIPDSELVNSPSAAKFDMAQFMAQHPDGYLNQYTEKFDGQELAGPDIVRRIAEELSVHPRLLLALLEYEGGWISNPSPSGDRLKYPLGIKSSARRTLSKQLSWAGARLNEGYYGWRLATRLWVQFADDDYVYMGNGVNAGTAGLQNYLAAVSTRQSFPALAGEDGFIQTYKELFGDPWQFDMGVLVPDDLQQPPMTLPWAQGDMWYFTGGPHATWGVGSPMGAVDFVPEHASGCGVLSAWVTALAPGVIARSVDGEVAQALDPSGNERIGWSIFYMHVGTPDRVPVGTHVQPGDAIGHPSCEGGDSSGSHLHLARKYNGEWIPAGGNTPFEMSGWVVQEGSEEYDGTISNGETTRDSCDCKDQNTNGLSW